MSISVPAENFAQSMVFFNELGGDASKNCVGYGMNYWQNISEPPEWESAH
jgi:hypothetical protein